MKGNFLTCGKMSNYNIFSGIALKDRLGTFVSEFFIRSRSVSSYKAKDNSEVPDEFQEISEICPFWDYLNITIIFFISIFGTCKKRKCLDTK